MRDVGSVKNGPDGAPVSEQERAERSSATLHSRDRVAKAMGMEIARIAPGEADLTMVVGEDHVNGHGICHGGIIYTLADTAFAHACNSRNQNTVAQHNTISYIAPGQLGETLQATARETNLSGRNGLYEVVVTGEDGRTIAHFRGASRAIRGQLFEE